MSSLMSGLSLVLAAAVGAGGGVYYQAHRGGVAEAPENTMAAFRHAWGCPGAVPEVDIRTSSDGKYVCIHDDTPGRTTNAPPDFKHRKISSIESDTIRQWDAGAWFSAECAGEKVPFLTEVFEEMKGRPERELYLDAKHIELDALAELVLEYGIGAQVIFTHEDPELAARFKEKVPGARSMTWLSGPASLIKSRFEKLADKGFANLDQLQLHLRVTRTEPEMIYALEDEFLREAVERAQAGGVALQLRPFEFNAASLRRLRELGVRWFVTDEPRKFCTVVAEAEGQPAP